MIVALIAEFRRDGHEVDADDDVQCDDGSLRAVIAGRVGYMEHLGPAEQ